MLPDPEKLGIASKSDWAVALLAGTVGYSLDAALNVLGFVEPGMAGVLFTTTAIGVKKGYEASVERRDAVRWAKRAEAALRSHGYPDAADELASRLAIAVESGQSAAEIDAMRREVLQARGLA